MATKQITTWDEFVTALTETITESTTYEIMNDIDVSDRVISSRIEVTGSSQTNTKTFQPTNGIEYIKINGITSYSSIDSIFYLYTQVTFNKIKFENFMIQNTALFSNGVNYYYFNSCFFNGVCYRFVKLASGVSGSATEHVRFSNCSLNIKYLYTLDDGWTSFRNCYIILNNDAGRKTSAPYIYACSFVNCYIGGKYVSESSYSTQYLIQSTERSGTYSSSYGIYNCVINVDFTVNQTATTIYAYYTYNNYTLAVPTIFNSDKIKYPDETSPTITYRTNGVALTDTQLKSKTYIQENTNFPLLG